MEFVIYSRKALCTYVFENSAVFPSKKDKSINLIKTYILDLDFQSKLDNLIIILYSIYETQKTSKSNSAKVD